MTLPDFSQARILVIGDVMADHYWLGSVGRVSPEAPVPVVHINNNEIRVGGAGNVALNAASLGAKVQLIGLVGDDAAGREIETILVNRSVQCFLQRVPGCITISKQRVIARNQQLLRLDFEDGFSGFDEKVLEHEFEARLPTADIVILSDYAKGTLRNAERLIKASLAANKFVIVDPKSIDFARYVGASLLTPNMAEFEAVVGRCSSDALIENHAQNLLGQLDLHAILITRSADGMTLLMRDQPPLHVAAQVQEVFDVTGAGDTVVATLAVALASGLPLQEATHLANLAAGLVVKKLGTATVCRNDLERAFQQGTATYPHHVLDEQSLFNEVVSARANGEVIVMTNGCFDILHPGHIECLEHARSLGDRLIVAINDDLSVQRLKGKDRPINPLSSRMRMLSALRCVDWIVPFSADTPEHLYRLVQPHVLVKGGDYSVSDVIGGDTVVAYGGKIHIFERLPGYSSSDIIQRIQDMNR